MQKRKKLNRHSNEINEIIKRQPPWIVRWGIVSFAISLLGIILLTNFIPSVEKIKVLYDIKISTKPKDTYVIIFIRRVDKKKIHDDQTVLFVLSDELSKNSVRFDGKIKRVSDSPEKNGMYRVKLIINDNKQGKIISNPSRIGMIILDKQTLFQRMKNLYTK